MATATRTRLSPVRSDLHDLGESERASAVAWISHRTSAAQQEAYDAGFEQGWNRLLALLQDAKIVR